MNQERSTSGHETPHFPASEIVKSIPGFFGIRLEEKPKYEVLHKAGHFEIRQYAPMLLAQVAVVGHHDYAVDVGFDKLASYIFGQNNSRVNMSMTNPVLQEKRGREWMISFVVPSKFNLLTVPKPLNSEITFQNVPGQSVASFGYSGNNDIEKMKLASVQLKNELQKTNYYSRSPVFWAQYDAPFTIPILKRNEAWMLVAPRHA